MRPIAAIIALGLAAPAAAEDVAPTAEPAKADVVSGAGAEPVLWAGRSAVTGTRKVPIIGTIDFRTDNYLLATVSRTEAGGYALEQQVCKVTFEKAAGASISLDEKAAGKMHTAYPVFEPHADGGFAAAEWPSGWGEEDLDEDGRPGMAVRVQAPLCGGTLHVASEAKSLATATLDGDRFFGDIDIHVDQQIQEVDGACLRWMSSDRAEWMKGKFVYTPAPADATCDTISEWADPMPEAASKGD